MINNISSLLFYPFEKEQIQDIEPHSKILFWNLEYCPEVKNYNNSDCVQSFKPYADIFTQAGIASQNTLNLTEKYAAVFCVLPKQKEAALYMMAQSFDLLIDDGLLVCVAANDAGGKNIEKWMTIFGANPSSLSKSKCRICWANKQNINQDILKEYRQKGARQTYNMEGTDYKTQAGIYGWQKIDKGSKILVEHLPLDLKGVGADFGCGYGYLLCEILRQNEKIKKIFALEADYNALICAQENLKFCADKIEIDFQWADLTKRQPALNGLDWIIMNPPFHEGKKEDKNIGKKFIVTAKESLKKKGVLYMVANAHLPYEKILEDNFEDVQKIYEGQGFKIYRAQK